MSEKERRYRNELKKLEGMFGLTFSDKERNKIIEAKMRKEDKGESSNKRRQVC